MRLGWRIPSPCGDFRLSKDGKDYVLEGEDLTAAEIAAVEKFVCEVRVKAAEGKGWSIKEDAWLYSKEDEAKGGAQKVDRVCFRFSSPQAYAQVTSLLCEKTVGTKGVITAVRSHKGVVSVTTEAVEKIKLGETSAKKKEDQSDSAIAVVDPPVLAVTTPRPTLCCPVTIPGPIDAKADWLLRAFLTEDQQKTWERDRFVLVRGSHSGHLYRIAHRHSPLAIRQSKCAWDLTKNHLMHAHATWLPPAEEVLCLMLALGWTEPWVRNPSGNLSAQPPMYPNPFMSEENQVLDGTDSAQIVSGLGAAFQTVATLGPVLLPNFQPLPLLPKFR